MNNDLSKLSERELNIKVEECNTSMSACLRVIRFNEAQLKKLSKKRRVNREEYDTLKLSLHNMETTRCLVNEYHKTLLDEDNSRMNKPASVEAEIRTTLKFNGYNEDLIHVAISTANKSSSKLEAIKTLKEDNPPLGLKHSKEIMDIIFKIKIKNNK